MAEMINAAALTHPAGDSDDGWHLDPPTERDGIRRVGINARAALDLVHEAKGNLAGVKVVVFDTGVQLNHPALPSVSREHARDFDNTLSKEGLDADHGWIANPLDAHGTACAGIIAAVPTERAPRIQGVAPGVTIIPIRISTNFDEDCLVGALKHAGKVGDVIAMPRHLPRTHKVDQALKELARAKPVICASGNSGAAKLIYPAELEEVIAVGACNDKGWRSSYSQYGAGLDLVAPSDDALNLDRQLVRVGPEEVRRRAEEEIAWSPSHPEMRQDPQDRINELGKKLNVSRFGELSIATTDNLGESGYNISPAGDYCHARGNNGFGGTSAACAQVAGVVALMLAVNRDLTPGEIKTILVSSASYEFLYPELEPEPAEQAKESVEQTAQNREAAQEHRREAERRRRVDEFGAGLVRADVAVQKVLDHLQEAMKATASRRGY